MKHSDRLYPHKKLNPFKIHENPKLSSKWRAWLQKVVTENYLRWRKTSHSSRSCKRLQKNAHRGAKSSQAQPDVYHMIVFLLNIVYMMLRGTIVPLSERSCIVVSAVFEPETSACFIHTKALVCYHIFCVFWLDRNVCGSSIVCFEGQTLIKVYCSLELTLFEEH